MQNFLTMLAPRKQDDGSIVFAFPISGKTKLSLLATEQDYGAYVREAIESSSFGPGSEVLAAADELTFEEIVEQFNEGAFFSSSFRAMELIRSFVAAVEQSRAPKRPSTSFPSTTSSLPPVKVELNSSRCSSGLSSSAVRLSLSSLSFSY
jgi:hypothetical protein